VRVKSLLLILGAGLLRFATLVGTALLRFAAAAVRAQVPETGMLLAVLDPVILIAPRILCTSWLSRPLPCPR